MSAPSDKPLISDEEDDESITVKGKTNTALPSSVLAKSKLTPVEEDYDKNTIHAGAVTSEEITVEGESAEITAEDEDFHEITVQTEASWYPPLPIPEGVDNDNFQGDDNHPLHRGRWIIFLGYNKENAGTHYGQKYCETLSNRAHFKINGSGEVNSTDVFISALTRAEVRQPMTIDFDFEIKESEGQDPRAFQFALCTPDPRDGFIQDSNLYGRVMWSIQALVSGSGKTHFWSIDSGGSGTSTDSESWEPDLLYHLKLTLTQEQGMLKVIWLLTSGGYSFDGGMYIDNSRSRTIRSLFTAYSTEQNEAYTEFFVDDFSVFRPTSKKTKVIVSIKHGAEFIMASEDVIDFNVSNREGSYPSASLSLKNITHKYHDLSVVDEIEIRAGWEHKLYLLFRGNLDTPEKRFPPCTLDIASNKGFARRLDFLETHNESWVTEDSGAIVQYLISEYFSGVFTADWVAQGIETSLDSDGEMVGSLIQKLASMNGFIVYVDFNKCLHFLRAEDEKSQSNLVLREAEDVLDIVNRMVDEIINSVTVNGASDSYTAQDAASIAAFWKRERSFSDESLTSAGAVQSRAEELLAALKDPFQEIPIKLPEVFLIELYDRCVIDCNHVGLDNEEISVKSTYYSFSSGGYRTTINGLHKGFSIAELLADTNRKLQGIT
jgi:hypothetical protein